jgi:protein disulfide-isomerase-like protein
MAEEAPAPLPSIQARIAALRQQQVVRTPDSLPQTAPPSYDQTVASRKKGPPPPLPKRPAGNRSESTNNPPLVSNGVASSRTVGNQPAGPRDVIPPPRMAKWEKAESDERPVPSLPPRRPSQAASEKAPPSLPPRRPSEANSLTRKPSAESVSSINSGRSSVISSVSTRTSFSVGSGNQYPKNRIRAPEYDPAALPPLPERKVKEEPRLPLRPTVSAPNGLPLLNRKASRDPPPALPSRPSRQNTIEPPPTPRRSALEFGLNRTTIEPAPPPIPRNRPSATNTSSTNTSPLVELDSNNFDEVVLRSGNPVFVDFYAPFCKYCKEIDPEYLKLAEAFQDSGIIIAKVDSYTNKEIGERYDIQGWPTFKLFDGRSTIPIDYESGSTVQWFSQFITRHTGIKPGDRSSLPPSRSNVSFPPPVPLSSRPNLAELEKMKPKVTPTPAQTGVCLKCRDFSGPDNHAARFPRESIPSTDTNWLAHQLCDPFPSATDKARAIFTWLHHNVAYDTVAFFNNNVQRSTPNSTLATGLAVCEGYAALFTALATAVGLQSVVVGGHGKGELFQFPPIFESNFIEKF